jgi:SM-20-related protein
MWQAELTKNGYVQLNNFLPENQANQLRGDILKASHYKAWDLITTPYHPLSRIKNSISSSIIDKARHTQATNAYHRREFSFSFYRSNNRFAKQHNNASIHKSLAKQVIQMVSKPLELDGGLRDTFFASFVKGQFINYHTDGSAGKYAFIYQLSKGWQPKFGGQLELYPRKIKFYKKILQPTFNSLAILKLDHPMPHSVRMLHNPAHKHRITISGWLE